MPIGGESWKEKHADEAYWKGFVSRLESGGVEAIKLEWRQSLIDGPARYGWNCERGLVLINNFFRHHKEPVDLAVILYSGLNYAPAFVDHLDGNGLQFYRPRTSHKHPVKSAFGYGEAHPERELLIIDVDMMKGSTLQESAVYFEGLGYDRSDIYSILCRGRMQKDFGRPVLKQIDDLLKA